MNNRFSGAQKSFLDVQISITREIDARGNFLLSKLYGRFVSRNCGNRIINATHVLKFRKYVLFTQADDWSAGLVNVSYYRVMADELEWQRSVVRSARLPPFNFEKCCVPFVRNKEVARTMSKKNRPAFKKVWRNKCRRIDITLVCWMGFVYGKRVICFDQTEIVFALMQNRELTSQTIPLFLGVFD